MATRTRSNYASNPTFHSNKKPLREKKAAPKMQGAVRQPAESYPPPYPPQMQQQQQTSRAAQTQIPPNMAPSAYPPNMMPPQQPYYSYPQQPAQGSMYPQQAAAFQMGNMAQGQVPVQQYPNHAYSGQAQGIPPQKGVPEPAPINGMDVHEAAHGPSGQNKWVGWFVLAIMPVLFIISLLVPGQAIFKWLFILACVIGLGGMWLTTSYAPGPKMTLSIVYLAMFLMTVVTLFVPPAASNSGDQRMNPSQTQSGFVSSGTQFTAAPTLPGFSSQADVIPTMAPEADTASEAVAVLTDFFYQWGGNQLSEMLKYCAPSWKSDLKKPPETELFSILKNRIPSDFVVESISGTEANSSRTITCSAMIDAQNTQPASKIRFQVIMLKEGGSWYVSPVSLTSNVPVRTPDPQEADTIQDQNAAAPTVTPVPDKKMRLYYNPDGGKYYHANANCTSLDKKYLPLKSFFNYEDVSTSRFKALLPCTKCNAPGRP